MARENEPTPYTDLAPSETTGSVVSDYLGYGSYSGADIKVVVNIPKSAIVQKDLARKVQDLESQIAELQSLESDLIYVDSFPFVTRVDNQPKVINNPQQVENLRIETNERISVVSEDLDIASNDLADFINSPTTITLGEISSISWSVFREKSPVKTLGSVYPKSICRGHRCIPSTEKVYVRDKGLISIADCVKDDYVQSSGLTFNKVLGSYKQGYKECYKIKLQNGYELRASFDHPISTERGWVHMEDLKKNDLIHVCGSVPSHNNDYDLSDDLLKMIAYLIGDGTTRKYKYDLENGKNKITTRIALSINDKEMDYIGKESEEILDRLNIGFNDNRKDNDKCIARVINVCKKGKGTTDWRTREYNILHEKLNKYNLYDKYSHTKKIPDDFIYGLSTRQIKIFLSRLFATDGGYCISKDLKDIAAVYTSTSEELVEQIRLLLLKLGINTIKCKESKKGKKGGKCNIVSRHDAYKIVISESIELIKFIKRIGIYGKDNRILKHIPLLKSRIKTATLDVDSRSFFKQVKRSILKQGLSLSDFSNLYSYNRKVTPMRAIKLAKAIDNDDFYKYVDDLIEKRINKANDLITKKIISKEKIGLLPVYDLEVEERHCFICNHIKVHNTIAGTMVFTIFHKHALHELLEKNFKHYSTGTSDYDRQKYTSMLADQLPPLDISLVFANEYGAVSNMGIYGVEFNQEGGTFSVEDIFSESVIQYTARDLDPMKAVQTSVRTPKGLTDDWTKTATQLMAEEDSLYGHIKRRNPFI